MSDVKTILDQVQVRGRTSSFIEADRVAPAPLKAQPRLSKRDPKDWLILLLLVGVGIALRFHMLGAKSLWGDEAFSVLVARMPWHVFFNSARYGEGNMVLYYLLLRPWVHLGDSEFWLRSLSALIGVSTIPAIYKIGKDFLSAKAGVIAATLLAIHSYHIRYSQELRSYTLVALLVVLSTYAFLAMIEKPDRRIFQALYVLSSALAVYAQVLAVFVLLSQWLALTPKRIRQFGEFRLLGIGAAVGVLTAPMGAVTVLENKGQLGWVPHPTPARMLDVILNMAGANVLGPSHSMLNVFLFVLYAGAWTVALSSFFIPRYDSAAAHESRETADFATRVLASGFIFPIILIAAVSLHKPLLVPRFLLMCVPAAILLAAQGLRTIEQRLPQGRIVSSVMLVMIITVASSAVGDYYASFATYGHNWRAVTNYLLSRQEPGDAAIFYTFSGYRPFDYYVRRTNETTGQEAEPAVLFPLVLDRAGIEKRTASYRRIWFVTHLTIPTTETDRQTELIRSTLQARFRLVEQKDFSGTGATRDETGNIHVALYTDDTPTRIAAPESTSICSSSKASPL